MIEAVRENNSWKSSRKIAVAELKGTWIETFLADKRLGGRHGVIVRESTISEYAYHLQWMLKNGLDLQTASFEDIMKWLANYRSERKISTYSQKVMLIKSALRFLDRKEDAEKIVRPRRKEDDRAERVKNAVISDEDMAKLIRECPTLRDRLMVELFFELGGRRGEISNIRIKDVQFDEYGAIVMLTGKTGTGPRRIYECIPDLRNYLNEHPEKDDPNSPLLMTLGSKRPLSYDSIYTRIRKLSQRILGHPIYPHQFRHTRATKDARYFTDREMMKLNRWKRPDMVGVYAHLSNRDVDDKDLVLHGLKTKEEILRPIVEVIHCRHCKQENAPIAMFCNKCGKLLTQQTDMKEIEQMQDQLKQKDTELMATNERLARLEGRFEILLKEKA